MFNAGRLPKVNRALRKYVNKVRRVGLAHATKSAFGAIALRARFQRDRWHFRRVREYAEPTPHELAAIEGALRDRGVVVDGLEVEPGRFREFERNFGFSAEYHSPLGSHVHREKLLEHYLAWDLLDIGNWVGGKLR